MKARLARKLHRKAMTMNQPPKGMSDRPTLTKEPIEAEETCRECGVTTDRANDLRDSVLDFVNDPSTSTTDLDFLFRLTMVLGNARGAHTPIEDYIESLVAAYGLDGRLELADVLRMHEEFLANFTHMREMLQDIVVQYPSVLRQVINGDVIDAETIR